MAKELITFFATTYIHNWPLQHFSQDYGLASHTTHVVCVNFIREWWTLNCGSLQFNVDSERRSFKKLFHGRFIYSQSFWQKCVEKKSPKKYFSYFIFDDWPVIWTQTFASNKSPLYLLDHGDFNIIYRTSVKNPFKSSTVIQREISRKYGILQN